MSADTFDKQCRLLTDTELVAALSVDKDQYTAQFHLGAGAELSRRGIRLSEFKNRVVIRISEQDQKAGTIEQALETCNGSYGPFDILSFTNCVGETLIFQPGFNTWTGHYSDRGEYRFSFTIRASQGRGDVLRSFLDLQDWSAKVAGTFNISEWDILMESASADRIMSVWQLLSRESIPALITNSRFFCLSAIKQDACHGQPFKIMVPQDSLAQAQSVLRNIEQKIAELRREAQQRIREGDRQAELGVLTELILLAPNDARAHHRMGSLLLEMGHPEAAADAFIAALIHHRGHEELFRAAYQGLEEAAVKLPENVHILHNLATFSSAGERDPKRVETIYRKIIGLKPEDAMAHLHLGYFYYEQGDDISAYRHLKRYLELDPESEEQEAIEQILDQLRPISSKEDDLCDSGAEL